MTSRSRSRPLFSSAVLAAVAVCAPTFLAQAAPPPLSLCVPCTVEKVYDGDTATEVTLHVTVQVRYDSCWAPEKNQVGGPVATLNAKRAEGRHGRLFIPIDNAKNLSDLFTFGRVVGEIWLDGENESESQKQVRMKFASTKKGGVLGE